MSLDSVSAISSNQACCAYSDCIQSKWVVLAGCIGVIAGLIFISLSMTSVFDPVNSPQFISSLGAGNALIIHIAGWITLNFSVGVIILSLVLAKKNAHSLDEPHQGPLKEIRDLSFKMKESTDTNYIGPLSITTANVGMLPSVINAFQQIGHFFTHLVNPQQAEILNSASNRAHPVAEKFAEEASHVPILCCQEVFDTHASEILAETLANKGYSVIHGIGDKNSCLNSGLLFATRYGIDEKGLRFWKFTNLTQTDAYSSKGLLRVPLKVHLNYGSDLKIVIYTTHLQAQTNEKQVRQKQLDEILSLIRQDQIEDPSRVIFLAGDFNISDYEYDGSLQNEYTQNQSFFSQFHDFVQDKYGNATCQLEPKGTFYNMHAFGTGETAEKCLYDRILLYKGGFASLKQEHQIAIRTLFADKLSDHLPVTFTFNLQKLM